MKELGKGSRRIIVLIVISIIVGLIVICLPNYFIKEYEIEDFASKATIIAGSITLLGAVFTAFYKEISAYYKDRSDSAKKRWDLVLPMIKENYMPWITSASSLANSLSMMETGGKTDNKIHRILFLMAIFYGIRLRNLQVNGGYILLSNPKEEELVNQKYINLKKNFQWAEDDTPNLANKLAEIFVKNEKKDDPFTLSRFEEDLKKEPVILEAKGKLTNWISPENAKDAKVAIKDFEKTFKTSIDKLSSTWDN